MPCGAQQAPSGWSWRWRCGLGDASSPLPSQSPPPARPASGRGGGGAAGPAGRWRQHYPAVPAAQLPGAVPENEPAGTAVIELRAHEDPDEGEAGRLGYQMEALFDERSNGYFLIDADTGFRAPPPAGPRTKDTARILVCVVDHGSAARRSAATYLTVTVSDTNDHSPVFEQSEYRERVRENPEVATALTIRATDGDAPLQRQHALPSAGGARHLRDRRVLGVVRTRAVVDRRRRPATSCWWRPTTRAATRARSAPPPPCTSWWRTRTTTTPSSARSATGPGAGGRGRQHARCWAVQATDRDQGQNAAIHYSIVSGNLKGQFYLHSLSGSLDVINPLDFETIREYTLRIKAQDRGRPPLINSSAGLVQVLTQ